MTTSDNPIEALRAVHEAATPGPWRHARHGSHEVEAEPNALVADCGAIGRAAEDARAIAVTHNVMPELLAVAKAVADSDTIAALLMSDHPHASDCARALVTALAALRAKIREALR